MELGRILGALALATNVAVAVPAGATDAKTKSGAPPKSAPQTAAKRLEWTTRSAEAREGLAELQRQVETFQGGARVDLARKIVAADPEFALGEYYLSVFVPSAAEGQKHLDKAVELSAKASDGERRFIAALVLARGKEPAQAVEPLSALARDYPGDRVVHMLLGQTLAAANRVADARAEYEKAIAIDGSTPRAHSLIGNLLVLSGEYEKARAAYQGVLAMMAPGTAPGPVRYGVAFTYLYEGKVDAALSSLQTFVDEYRKAGAPLGTPEVFIWNSIARINLENGRLEEAMKAYEKGYESVPASGLDETEKTIWFGRLHHGRGRTLARMGHFDEAWKEAGAIRKLIDEGGERGKEFEPSYHYIAGYLKLEQGDTPGALAELKQTTLDDPFHKLLLARAYEKAGQKDDARKAYEDVVASTQNSLERALAYPEAKKKLSTL